MKRILLFVFCALAVTSLHAQEEEVPDKKFDPNNLFFGGSLGLSFGTYTLVNVTPQVGYRFNRYLAAGAGINFIYSSAHYQNYIPEYREEYGVVGLNIFGRVFPIQYIFLQLQPEVNYTWGNLKFYDGTEEQKLKGKFIPSLLGGLGGMIPTGARGGFFIMAQYDLLQETRNPYGPNVFFNFGYVFGM